MTEAERPAPTTQPVTPHETEETTVHPHQATGQHDADQHDTDQHDTAVHPDLGADHRDTAVLADAGSTWTPPAAGVGTGSGTGAGRAPAVGRRSPDLLALTAAVVFCLIAVLGLVGTSLPGWVFGGGFVAVVLVIAGAGLLVNELRRTRT